MVGPDDRAVLFINDFFVSGKVLFHDYQSSFPQTLLCPGKKVENFLVFEVSQHPLNPDSVVFVRKNEALKPRTIKLSVDFLGTPHFGLIQQILAFLNHIDLCASGSTSWKWCFNRWVETLPMPAPQSRTFPRLKCCFLEERCSRKDLEAEISI